MIIRSPSAFMRSLIAIEIICLSGIVTVLLSKKYKNNKKLFNITIVVEMTNIVIRYGLLILNSSSSLMIISSLVGSICLNKAVDKTILLLVLIQQELKKL